MSSVCCALGTNLGDRLGFLRFAVESLQKRVVNGKLQVSRLYETEPWGIPDQPNYLNCAVRFDTQLEPTDLLGRVKAIERDAGRVARPVWQQRELDIDILLYDDLIIRTPELAIPHPRMTERRFVLAPLCDIAPNREIPGTGATVRDALRLCADTGWIHLFEEQI